MVVAVEAPPCIKRYLPSARLIAIEPAPTLPAAVTVRAVIEELIPSHSEPVFVPPP